MMSKKKNEQAKFYVADPAWRYMTYDKTEFEDKWIKKNENKISGIALILDPQADFKQRQAGEKAERGKYLENIIGYFTPYKRSFLNLGDSAAEKVS